MNAPCPLVLASGSPYRKQQLEQLGLAFAVVPAAIDESPLAGESPRALVERLSLEKARTVARRRPGSAVLGLDQVAGLGDRFLGKPGSAEAARAQLAELSGRRVVFHSGVCLCFPDAPPRVERIETEVAFRKLEDSEIARYVERDRPFDCAGSFRSESLGPTLVEQITSNDPSALMGLPLITVAALLRRHGWQLP